MRKTILELLIELRESTNCVTDWSLKQCIIDRLNNKTFSDDLDDLYDLETLT